MDVSERLRERHPDGADALDQLNAVADGQADTALLALCLTCVDEMLEGRSYRRPDDLGPREIAAIGFTEQFVLSVGDLGDEHVDALLEHLTPEQVHRFVGALYVGEMTRRVGRVAAEVLR